MLLTGLEALGDTAEAYLATRRMSRLTREQIDVLERMRGRSSHGQYDCG